jgi:hypothetical protein
MEVLEWFGNREIFIKVHKEKQMDIDEVENFLFR